MNLKELLKKYVNRESAHKREVGRYWVSDLWAIMTGELLPENFLKDAKKNLLSCSHIQRGIEKEDTLKKILDYNEIKYEYQEKKELKIDDFVLVAIADFSLEDRILELKAPMILPGSIKEWHRPQLEAQHRLFNKPVYVGYVKEWNNPLFYEYRPCPMLWEIIQRELRKFHRELKKL
jgi:hypothetical protein